MAVALKPPLTIGIADEIRDDPKLFESVRAANSFLETLLESSDFAADHREVSWSLTDQSAGDVTVRVAERDHYGQRQAHLTTTPQRLADPVAREVAMSQLLRQILRQQYFQIGEGISRMIEEMEREEQHAHAH